MSQANASTHPNGDPSSSTLGLESPTALPVYRARGAAVITAIYSFYALMFWVGAWFLLTHTSQDNAEAGGLGCVLAALFLTYSLLDQATLKVTVDTTSISRRSRVKQQRYEFTQVDGILEFSNWGSTILRVFGNDKHQIILFHRNMA